MISLLIKIIEFYQKYISILFPKKCRFYPSCSQYCILSLKKHKTKGIFFCFLRVLKCNPLFKGGIDLP